MHYFCSTALPSADRLGRIAKVCNVKSICIYVAPLAAFERKRKKRSSKRRVIRTRACDKIAMFYALVTPRRWHVYLFLDIYRSRRDAYKVRERKLDEEVEDAVGCCTLCVFATRS